VGYGVLNAYGTCDSKSPMDCTDTIEWIYQICIVQYNPRLIHERRYQVRFSSSVWPAIIGDIILRPLYAARQANCSTIRTYQFSGKIFYWALWKVWLSVRPNLRFHYDGAPTHDGDVFRQWLNAT
jgi:hypothetical protein